ncbi:10253_t:CDS:2 [Paraglomus occultum]|uniref:10253_t:CDS:1 n=1 Tax=Paraglomus occultum TaxID=144539 RepID=A0A9N9AMV0_9GLOM|nr:10253_t:CDS:2 [Paraglomus occultum]
MDWVELIKDPVSFTSQKQKIFEHKELPKVKNAVSITFRIKLKTHSNNWATIFHKGTGDYDRTPGTWLSAGTSHLHARFTGNYYNNAGIDSVEGGLLLGKWYHVAYTLSDTEKRLDIYVDGEWRALAAIVNVRTEQVIFNKGPLHIGRAYSWDSFNGEISSYAPPGNPYPQASSYAPPPPYSQAGHSDPYPQAGYATSGNPYPQAGYATSGNPYPQAGYATSGNPYPQAGYATSGNPYPQAGSYTLQTHQHPDKKSSHSNKKSSHSHKKKSSKNRHHKHSKSGSSSSSSSSSSD